MENCVINECIVYLMLLGRRHWLRFLLGKCSEERDGQQFAWQNF